MTRKLVGVALFAFLLGSGTVYLLVKGSPGSSLADRGRGGQKQLYYCPMHPTMISDQPGDCPICQMRMVPMEPHEPPPPSTQVAPSAPPAGPAVAGRAPIRLSAQKQQLIGMRTVEVRKGPLVKHIRTVGRVAYDETRLHHVHTKVGGWIERLHADATGEMVTKGQPLLTIYSPELVASTQEYLLALRTRDRLAGATQESLRRSGDGLVESARRRLLLFDLTPEQIEALEVSGEAPRTVTLYAPSAGHIVARNVTQGERIEPGVNLLDIADLERVWILADVYEYEIPYVREGQKATMTLSYLPGRKLEGVVRLVYPVLSEQTRTVKVRLEFPNPDLALKPEMFADVELHVDLGERLVVPDSAVIGTGERDIVFLERGEGLFEPREVTLGARLTDTVEVLEGLSEGDRVVASGNFLVDSESRLKAALSAAGAAATPGSPAAPTAPPSGHVH